MKVAIIGAGVAGLTAAYLLRQSDHQVLLFEKEARLGGHAYTYTLEHGGPALDLGFMVFNKLTYPNFSSLLDKLGVPYEATRMSISITDEEHALEYRAASMQSLLAHYPYLWQQRTYRLIYDILRFRWHCRRLYRNLETCDGVTLLYYLQLHRFSDVFIRHFLQPMLTAIWTGGDATLREFPLKMFIEFFQSHRTLHFVTQPKWYTLKARSQDYIDRMAAAIQGDIFLKSGVQQVCRKEQGCVIKTTAGEVTADYVIFACRADSIIEMLDKASSEEINTLANFLYQDNRVVLHTDAKQMPSKRAHWASWNMRINPSANIATTYYLNLLQNLSCKDDYFVTTNPEDLNADKIITEVTMGHPQYRLGTLAAQQQYAEINGKHNTGFCGAYWRYGFHEDGVMSALAACAPLGVHALV